MRLCQKERITVKTWLRVKSGLMVVLWGVSIPVESFLTVRYSFVQKKVVSAEIMLKILQCIVKATEVSVTLRSVFVLTWGPQFFLVGQ